MRFFNVLMVFLFACTAAMAQNSESVFQMIKHDLPASVRPGERITAHIVVKCIAPGVPTKCYPSVEMDCDGVSLRATPWLWDAGLNGPNEASVALGANIEERLFIDVPLDIRPTDGKISFSIVKDKGSTKLLDVSGKDTGKPFVWHFKVQPAVTKAVPIVSTRMAAPKIDGRVGAEEWKGTIESPSFVDDIAGQPGVIKTRIRLGYDDSNLYVAVVCAEPSMNRVKAVKLVGRDPANYENESVELFIDPKADRASYYHFVSDILGQKYDALGSDSFGYNPAWQNASFKGTNFWSTEIAIPFSSITAARPTPGDSWLANFSRGRHAGDSNEVYALNATGGSLNGTSTFTPIVFDSVKLYLAKSGDKLSKEAAAWPDDVRKSAAVWISNLSAWERKVNEAGSIDDAAYIGYASEISALQKEVEPYRIKALSILAGGSPFYVTRSWPYEQFTGQNSGFDTKLGPVDVTLLKDEWADVALNIANISDKPITLRCSTRYGTAEEFSKLGLPGLETVWQEAMAVGSRNGNPAWDAIQPVSAGAFEIPAGSTKQVWLSIHVPKNYGGNESTVKGSIKIEAVDGNRGKSQTFPISVNVLPQVLTENPPVHGFTWNLLWPIMPKDSPQWTTAHFADLKAHGIDVFMLHGLRILPRPMANPDGTLQDLDFSRFDDVVGATKDTFGMYYITIDIWEKDWVRKDLFGLEFPKPAYEKAFKSWVRAIVARLKDHGVGYDRFVVNAYDESVSDDCYFIAKWIKEADPQIRTILDSIGPVDVIKKFEKYNDVWVPHFNQYQSGVNQPSIDEMRKEGKDLWVYWYSEGGNDKHQQPNRHYLYKYWWAFQNDVTGVAYWAQQYYGDPWNRAEATSTYDTSLVYPTETGCIPSRRWQAWRQGWQDYCLFDLTEKDLNRRKDTAGLARMNSLIDKALRIPADPRNFEAARDYAKQVLAGE